MDEPIDISNVRRHPIQPIKSATAPRSFRVRMLLAIISVMPLAQGTSGAAPTAGGEPALVWKTSGSVTFAAADGAEVWLIEASGGLEAPKASLVRIGPAGASRVTTF